MADDAIVQIFQNLEKFEVEGSGWALQETLSACVHFSEYAPRKLVCMYHPLLEKLKVKHRNIV